MYRPTCRCLRLPSKLRRRVRRRRLSTMLILLFILLTLLSPLYIIYKPPALLIRYFQYRWHDVLFHVQTSEKVIALTIDDAPSAFTAEILHVLEQNEAKATFFVIGAQVEEGRGEVLREIVARGNELGNHAMHDEASRALSDAELSRQIEHVEGLIHKAYDEAGVAHPPRYFRPGSGFFSDRMRVLVKRMSYQLVLGDVYPHDPQIAYPRVNAAHVLSMVRPGAIVVCHDRRGWTAEMLKRVLPEVRRRGYRVVTVSELLGAGAEGEGNSASEEDGDD